MENAICEESRFLQEEMERQKGTGQEEDKEVTKKK